MSLIKETIKEQKLQLTEKQLQALTNALQDTMADMLDKSLGFGYHMGKSTNDIQTALRYARRTFTTNI